MKLVEAEALADFLMLILKWEPKNRATAQDLINHRWLSMPADYSYKMTDLEYKKFKLKQTVESTNNDFLQFGKSSGKE